jgi:BMFP domain-containing protein YqiC
MDSPTAQAFDHLTAEIAALIRRIEDLEAHQYATGQGVASLASRVQKLEGPQTEPPPKAEDAKKPVKAAK